MDDITPATRRMTYAELGKGRGVSAKSAERLVQRRRWPRQIGNDGIARVLVPLGEDHVAPRHQGPMTIPDVAEHRGRRHSPDIGEVIREAIREVVAPLSAQLERAEQRLAEERARAERAEQRVDTERGRANEAERRLADKDATMTGLVAEKQVLKQEVETLTELARARRSWWGRVFGR